jgi:hypothetical protein
MPPFPLMFNNRETALSAMVIAAVLVASFFAISFVQQALAQGNASSAGGNMTAGKAAVLMNKTGGNATAGGGAMMNNTAGK